ncbi:DUF418 domain-containing protein [Sphingomonas xanthus]|nr:DUF418 domain-containing protein [Sphingomonas xanthus]
MSASGTSTPIPTDERSALLDSLRGYALLGILVANMMVFSGWIFLPEATRTGLPLAGFDSASELLIEWLVVGKFYSIFSLLFGIGFAIQIGRFEARGEGVGRYARRLFYLFLIGLAHIYLLWLGDIVALYAAMGAVLLLFRKVSNRALLGWAVLLWLVPAAWSAMIHLGGIDPAAPLAAKAFAMIRAASGDLGRGPMALFASPDIAAHLRAHPGEALLRLSDLVYQMRFTKVLGMFLLGLWIGRRAIYANLAQYRPLLVRTAKFGLGIGLPLSAARAILSLTMGNDRLLNVAAECAYVVGTPTLALGYAALFALLWDRPTRGAWLEWSAPAGRMALTNYLMQTILQSIIFYGWGFGLIGKIGLVIVIPMSLALFALQVAYSRWWLARFRFGPVEWLWRSLTYGRAQPMRAAFAA